MPDIIFNPLFAALESLQRVMDPARPHVCYCVGATNVGKSSTINAICRQILCKPSHDHTPGTTDFQVIDAPEANAIFVDTMGFGSNLMLNANLTKKIEMHMKNVQPPDVILLFVTKDQLRFVDSLKKVADYVNIISKWLKKRRYASEVPIVCVLNKIDEYFGNQLPSTENETRKVEEYTKSALEIVNKYLVFPATKIISVSAIKNYGIDELRRILNAASPLNAQIIDKNLDYISQQRVSMANKIIATFSTASAAVSFLPLIDIVIVTVLQEWMYCMLTCFSVDPARTPSKFKAIHESYQYVSLGARTGALFIGGIFQVTIIGYLIGSAICVAAASTSTAALGWACYYYFID